MHTPPDFPYPTSVSTDAPPAADPSPASPGRWLALLLGLLALHAVLWTVLPVVCYDSAPLDVGEMLYWGQQRPMGTYKHPPLPAWAADLAFTGAGGLWGVYLLSQLATVAAVLATYGLARTMLPRRESFFAALATLTLYLVTYTSPEFNNNVALLFFWTVAITLVRRGLKAGAVAGLGWWIAAAGALAGAGLSKYAAVFLAGSLALYMLCTREGRRALRTPGPWLCAGLSIALTVPHLRWMQETGWVGLEYARTRADRAPFQDVLSLLNFVLVIAATMIPAALCLWPLRQPPLHRRELARAIHEATPEGPSPDDRRYLFFVAIVPILLHIAVGIVMGVGLRAAWATCLLMPLPLWLLSRTRTRPAGGERLSLAAIGAVLAIFAGVFAVMALRTPRWPDRSPRIAFPMDQLAEHIGRRWTTFIRSGQPPALIGDAWLAAGAAIHMPTRPPVSAAYERLFEEPPPDPSDPLSEPRTDPRIDPWVRTEDLRVQGGVILWRLDPSGPTPTFTTNDNIIRMFPTAFEVPPIELTYPGSDSPIRVGIAIIPPLSVLKGG